MSSEKPAGPHVTGDGDGGVSDEVIAAEMAMEEIDTFGPPEDEDALAGIITKAIARGRALGAREENEACSTLARDRAGMRNNIARKTGDPDERNVQVDLASECREIADEIARRAGRGTL